jgi:Flp pilus assembly protein TadD
MPDFSSYAARVTAQPDNELFRFSYGKVLFDAGDFTQAEEHLRVALNKKPEWMVVTMLLAQCALKRNAKDEARALYESALHLAVSQNHLDPEAEIRAILASL